MVHHYTIGREEARDLDRRDRRRRPPRAGAAAGAVRAAASTTCRSPPWCCGALLRATGVRRVVFSASGLREGWFMQRMPRGDPRARTRCSLPAGNWRRGWAAIPNLPPALLAWTDPLFPAETGEARRLREAACWMSDIGSHDHPEFRAEQAFLRVLRQPGIGLDHHARAFLALAIAMRYEVDAEAPFLRPARLLLDVPSTHRAEVLGVALRLAYTLSAGTPDLLAGTALRLSGGRLVLRLQEDSGVFAGESVMRRLDRLAQALGLEAATEAARERAA